MTLVTSITKTVWGFFGATDFYCSKYSKKLSTIGAWFKVGLDIKHIGLDVRTFQMTDLDF